MREIQRCLEFSPEHIHPVRQTRTSRMPIILWAIATLLGVFAPSTSAQIVDTRLGEGFFQVGPTNRTDGFPVFITSKGTPTTPTATGSSFSLEPCLTPKSTTGDPCGLAAATEPGVFDPDKTMVWSTNYPSEIFYYRATSGVPVPGSVRTVLWEAALEAAFLGGVPKANDQVLFARFRVVVPPATLKPVTHYVLKHPYGVLEFDTDNNGVFRTTVDDGCVGPPCGDFSQILHTPNLGGMLHQNPLPAPQDGVQYLGTTGLEVASTGSPIGFDRLELWEVSPTGAETIIGSNSGFDITGRVFDGPIPPFVDVTRSSYTLAPGGTSRIEVFARALPGSIVTASINGFTQQLTSDPQGQGNFFASFNAGSSSVPPFVRVTASNALGTASSFTDSPITDHISIDSAAYNPTTKRLSVIARSSDSANNPEISVTDVDLPPAVLGILSANTLNVDLPVPPAVIRLNSSKGGTTTRGIELMNGLQSSVVSIRTAAGSPNPAMTVDSGAAFTLHVAVTDAAGTPIASAGTVTIVDGSQAISGPINQDPITLNYTVTLLGLTTVPSAQHPLKAVFSGDGFHLGATSANATAVTVRYPTNVVVTPSPLSGSANSPLAVTATVSSAGPSALVVGSTMRFFITDANAVQSTSDVLVTTATAASRAITLNWVPSVGGRYTVVAAYLGDSLYSASTNSASVIANIGVTPTMTVSALQGSYLPLQQFIGSVSLPSTASGSVRFEIGTTFFDARNNGTGVWTATLTTPAAGGVFTATARYTPDANSLFSAATQSVTSRVQFPLSVQAKILAAQTATPTATTLSRTTVSQGSGADLWGLVSATGTTTLPTTTATTVNFTVSANPADTVSTAAQKALCSANQNVVLGGTSGARAGGNDKASFNWRVSTTTRLAQGVSVGCRLTVTVTTTDLNFARGSVVVPFTLTR